MSASPRARREALERSDGRCTLCGIPPVSADIHHLVFVSMGGSDDPDNLVTLCPTCHRNFPHTLYAPEEAPVLRAASNRAELLASTRRNIAQSGAWPAAAEALVHAKVREAALSNGFYSLVVALGREIFHSAEEADRRSPLAVSLAAVVTEAAAYENKLDPNDSIVRVVGARSSELESADQVDLAAFAEVRYHRAAGDIESEVAVLEQLDPSPSHVTEHCFRYSSALTQAKDFSAAAAATRHVDEIGAGPSDLGLMDTIALASIEGAKGAIAMALHEWMDARQHLADAFMASHSVFHRRGMYVSATRASIASMAAGDIEAAAGWLTLASAFIGVAGSAPTLDPDLRFDKVWLALCKRSGGYKVQPRPDRKAIDHLVTEGKRA